jgi:hypothetical protein
MSWLSLIGPVLKFIGLGDWVASALEKRAAKAEGVALQKTKDVETENETLQRELRAASEAPSSVGDAINDLGRP